MIRILKLKMFIAHLPLSALLCFRGKRYNLPGLSNLQIMLCFVICGVVAASQFLNPPQAEGAFIENMAIDTRAVSLANTVTASPPGIMSIAYNPAGLSLLPDGNFISLGVIPVNIKRTAKFEKDPNFEGFHDLKGNLIEDPLWGTRDGPYRFSGNNWTGSEGNVTAGKMYIPVLDVPLDFLVGPIFGVSHRNPGSKWTFAFSSYAPFAAGMTSGDPTDPTRYDGQSFYLQHLTNAPAVSYQINDKLSIGVSFGMGITAMGFKTDFRAPNELVNLTKVLGDATQDMGNFISDMIIKMPLFGGGIGPYEKIGELSFNVRDDFSPSFNLGVLWEPLDWLSFGVSYNSAIKTQLSGKFNFQYSDQWQKMVAWSGNTAFMQIVSMALDLPYEPVAQQSGTVTYDIEWPQMANVGIKFKPVKRLSLLADLHWANWSSIQQDNIVFDQKIQLLQLTQYMGYKGGDYALILKRDLKDTLNWGAGIEYQMLDWLTLRAGYEKRTTSTQDQYYDLLYCLPSLDYYGAGLGIKLWKDIDIDLAAGYMVNKSYKLPNNTSSNMNSTDLGSGVNNPYAGLNYEQEMEVYMGSVKATMPLSLITTLVYKGIDLLNPFKRSVIAPTKGISITTEKQDGMVDSSSKIVETLRVQGQYYYTEDSE